MCRSFTAARAEEVKSMVMTASAGTGAGGAALPRVLLAALVTGIATGAAVELFVRLVAAAEWLAVGWHAGSWPLVPWPLVLAIPVLGGLAVGLALHAFGVPEAPEHGVTQVIEAATLDHHEFRHHDVPLEVSVAALSLGTGASLGPEDPAVEIGGGVGETVGRAARLPHATVRALVAAGAAGGISAAFQAPVAAVLFAIEVFRVKPLSRTMMLVVAAAAAALVPGHLIATAAPFAVPRHDITLDAGIAGIAGYTGLALAIGLLGGALAAGQVRLTYFAERAFRVWSRPPRWLKPALGGVLLGGVGVFLPQLLGTGYATLELVAAGALTMPALLLALLAGKMLLVAISFGSGFLGGFFAPSLFIGATLGALVGVLAATLLPGAGVEPGTGAVIGMAALLAGAVHAPLTAVFLARALTGGFALVPFLIVACVTSFIVSRAIERRSLYTYHIKEGGAQATR
jgi:chloride channel protein, CIC family